MQSKRHKFLILELKFEDLIIHNTVKIKQKQITADRWGIIMCIDSMEHFRNITSTNGPKKSSQQ